LRGAVVVVVVTALAGCPGRTPAPSQEDAGVAKDDDGLSAFVGSIVEAANEGDHLLDRRTDDARARQRLIDWVCSQTRSPGPGGTPGDLCRNQLRDGGVAPSLPLHLTASTTRDGPGGAVLRLSGEVNKEVQARTLWLRRVGQGWSIDNILYGDPVEESSELKRLCSTIPLKKPVRAEELALRWQTDAPVAQGTLAWLLWHAPASEKRRLIEAVVAASGLRSCLVLDEPWSSDPAPVADFLSRELRLPVGFHADLYDALADYEILCGEFVVDASLCPERPFDACDPLNDFARSRPELGRALRDPCPRAPRTVTGSGDARTVVENGVTWQLSFRAGVGWGVAAVRSAPPDRAWAALCAHDLAALPQGHPVRAVVSGAIDLPRAVDALARAHGVSPCRATSALQRPLSPPPP
jgi:hypothetical protein